jgi:hypothetical protein
MQKHLTFIAILTLTFSLSSLTSLAQIQTELWGTTQQAAM